MTTTSASLADKTKSVLLWVVTVLAAMAMLLAGMTKFTAAEMWDGFFVEWGYSSAFKNVIGVLEIVGALGLLVPRLATYAGVLIGVIMLGAIYTVFANQSDLGFVANTGNLILFSIVAYARRNERWRPSA